MNTMNLGPQVPAPRELKRWMEETFRALRDNLLGTLAVIAQHYYLKAPLLLYCAMVFQKGDPDVFRDEPPYLTIRQAAQSLASGRA